MKLPLSWLKDHLETEADAATIADKLTNIGLEVESVENAGARLKDFIVAYVISAEKHPNADKLTVCSVDVGPAGGVKTIVCGAPGSGKTTWFRRWSRASDLALDLDERLARQVGVPRAVVSETTTSESCTHSSEPQP